jgi:hypothetical protein
MKTDSASISGFGLGGGEESTATASERSSLKLDRRMAILFLLALFLIGWQALRMQPVWPPSYEFGTRSGEQVLPVGVPSWRPPPQLSPRLPERLAFLAERSLDWPGEVKKKSATTECRAFVRISAQHWAERSASSATLQRWLGRDEPVGGDKPWRLLHFPVAAFLDDDDHDGDPLDEGELREDGPGAEVEVFCGAAARSPEEFR